jgi:hypothetical protein
MRGVYTTRFGEKFSKITESRQPAELPQTVSGGGASNKNNDQKINSSTLIGIFAFFD